MPRAAASASSVPSARGPRPARRRAGERRGSPAPQCRGSRPHDRALQRGTRPLRRALVARLARRGARAPGRPARAAARPAAEQERTGRRRTRSTTAGQKRESSPVRRCGRNGIRPRSIRGPSSSSTAGSTVTEPATAHATTAIVPPAMPLKMSEPITNMPAIAIATVVPETITVRPEVRAVRSSASCEASPRARSSRERIT